MNRKTTNTAETTPISLRLEPDIIAHLRRVARHESYKRNEDVSFSDLVREAILRTYPHPTNNNSDYASIIVRPMPVRHKRDGREGTGIGAFLRFTNLFPYDESVMEEVIWDADGFAEEHLDTLLNPESLGIYNYFCIQYNTITDPEVLKEAIRAFNQTVATYAKAYRVNVEYDEALNELPHDIVDLLRDHRMPRFKSSTT